MEEKVILTVSIGIVTIETGMTYHQLFEKVDHALYQSKKDGRNRISIE